MAAPLAHPTRGAVGFGGEPLTVSRTLASIVSALPEPGEHTENLLHELGCSEDEIARWWKAKVL
jgi:crotonobetainyl-CoA:carnitine CoA-transferase CaiB-like acyl-CoA transferase